jgi:y4mF family transcriptional regulator
MPKRRAKEPAPSRIGAMVAAVRRRRRELGMTQVELGRFAGCGPDFIYDLEAGKPTIRLAKLLDVLAVLGLELRLVEGRDGMSVDRALAEPPAPEA